jgi:hypothetical protein
MEKQRSRPRLLQLVLWFNKKCLSDPWIFSEHAYINYLIQNSIWQLAGDSKTYFGRLSLVNPTERIMLPRHPVVERTVYILLV